MQRQRGAEPPEPTGVPALFHGKQMVLAPLILGVAAALILALASQTSGARVSVPAEPTVPAVTSLVSASIAGQTVGMVATEVPTATPAPTDTPTPVPTPLPTATPENIRPLSGQIAPRVVDQGPAPVRIPGTEDPKPTTQHFIIVDGASGAILFQRNAYEPVAPASLTKIMTAIVGMEHGVLADHVKIDVDARTMDGSSLMGLEPWFDVTFQDLLYGLMLPSGNDAALAIARYVAGDDESFVRLMNEKAQWLGLRATHFVNPHGLDESDHYSTPADMVTMARYAMQYPLFRQVVSSKSYDIQESNVSYTIGNVNAILDAFPGADGVKTGYTDSAGRALVATAMKNGHRVYLAFMLSDNGAAADGALLLKWAFDSFAWQGGDDPVHQQSTVSADR